MPVSLVSTLSTGDLARVRGRALVGEGMPVSLDISELSTGGLARVRGPSRRGALRAARACAAPRASTRFKGRPSTVERRRSLSRLPGQHTHPQRGGRARKARRGLRVAGP